MVICWIYDQKHTHDKLSVSLKNHAQASLAKAEKVWSDVFQKTILIVALILPEVVLEGEHANLLAVADIDGHLVFVDDALKAADLAVEIGPFKDGAVHISVIVRALKT